MAPTRGTGARPIDVSGKPSADTVFLVILGVVAALVLALAVLLVKLWI